MTTTSADRVDLFSLIHKGLRRSLFDTALLLGRMDVGSTDDVAGAERAVARCFDFLREHAEHEDRHLVPALARVAPALAAALGAEHVELEKAAIELEALFPRLAVAAGADRPRLGREAFRRMNLLVADQLRHLEREEREGNATLWAYLPDSELAAIRGLILQDITPERQAAWYELCAPALTAREAQILRGPKAA